MSEPAHGATSPAARYGYFVLQARASQGSGSSVSGVLENLGTGEKQAFQGSAGLVRLLEEWSEQGQPQRT